MSRSLSKQYTIGIGTAITLAIHAEGFRLLRTGVQEKRIRKELGLTAAQWRWLKEEGNSRLPSYESMVIAEVNQIRTDAREGALELSRNGIEALKLRFDTARQANLVVKLSMPLIAEDIQDPSRNGMSAMSRLADCMPSPAVLQTLKVMRSYCELGPAADAFERIYGDSIGHKALYSDRDTPKTSDQPAAPLRLIQGQAADQQRFVSDQAVTEMIGDLDRMTDEQLLAYADGEDEEIGEGNTDDAELGEGEVE